MGNSGLSNDYVSSAAQSFKMICLRLLNSAYAKVLTAGIITYEWDENAISEVIVKSINDDYNTIQLYITASVENRLLPEFITQIPNSVDSAPRIDIKIGGFSRGPDIRRVHYYLEAKNLYSRNCKKANNENTTSSIGYANRYVSTGIDYILKGHYPEDALLLGYVLIGSVADAVDLVNRQLIKKSRNTEQITLQTIAEFPNLAFGRSSHPNDTIVEHCYLLFH